jgi:hypothetical protein
LTTRIECSQCEHLRESRNQINQYNKVDWLILCNVIFSL